MFYQQELYIQLPQAFRYIISNLLNNNEEKIAEDIEDSSKDCGSLKQKIRLNRKGCGSDKRLILLLKRLRKFSVFYIR